MVARRAHNPKAVGSNPAPATNNKFSKKNPKFGVFLYENLETGLRFIDEPNPFFMSEF